MYRGSEFSSGVVLVEKADFLNIAELPIREKRRVRAVDGDCTVKASSCAVESFAVSQSGSAQNGKQCIYDLGRVATP